MGKGRVYQDSCGGDDTVTRLKRHLRIFKQQKLIAQKAGRHSKMCLKAVYIQRLKDAIEKLNNGDLVDLTALPDPTKNTFSVAHTTKNDVPEDTAPTCKSTTAPEAGASPVVRKSNYCILCRRLVKKFSEHVESKHPESDVGQSLRNVTGTGRMRRLLKMKITDSVRKKWNAVYNRVLVNSKENFQNLYEDTEEIGVKRRSKIGDVPNVTCAHCEGLYRRDKLSVHLRYCKPYINSNKNKSRSKKPRSALKRHSKNRLPDVCFVTEAFQNEILKDKKIGKVLEVAVNDPLIMKFGSEFHKSRRANSDRDYVMRVIRDITRLFIIMKDKNPALRSFRDILNPLHFEDLCDAVLEMGKYDPVTGGVQVTSVAYRLSQPLKEIATLAKSELLGTMYAQEGVQIDRKNVMMIDDFLDIMSKRWKNTVGRIFTKSGKKQRVNRSDKMALEDDIVELAGYIENSYRSIMNRLRKRMDKRKHYDLLVHMLVVHAMLLIRRRPIDFKHASLQHYTNIDKHDELLEMSKGYDLTPENLEDCKRFHIFYVPGKNLEIVPIVFTPIMKEVCDTLIDFRKDVCITSDSLFSLSRNASIKPTESIKLLKRKVSGLKRPNDLTGNGLRHQAATFSRLKSTHPQYQDYLASTLGHTLAVHKKHYELPMGILQKIIVCPILNEIMTADNKHGSQSNSQPTGSRKKKKGKSSQDTGERVKKKRATDIDIDRSALSETGDEAESSIPTGPLRPGSRKIKKRVLNDSDESEADTSGSEPIEASRNVLRIESDESENDGEHEAAIETTIDKATPETRSNSSFDEPAACDGEVLAVDHQPVSRTDADPPSPNQSTSSSLSSSSPYSSGFSLVNDDDENAVKKKCTRTRWTAAEMAVVLEYFGRMILREDVPTRGYVVKFMKTNPELQKTRSVDQVVMFVRNYALRKQLNVTPTVRKYIKKRRLTKR